MQVANNICFSFKIPSFPSGIVFIQCDSSSIFLRETGCDT